MTPGPEVFPGRGGEGTGKDKLFCSKKADKERGETKVGVFFVCLLRCKVGGAWRSVPTRIW